MSEIEQLRAEIAALRAEIAKLKAGEVHYHYHGQPSPLLAPQTPAYQPWPGYTPAYSNGGPRRYEGNQC